MLFKDEIVLYLGSFKLTTLQALTDIDTNPERISKSFLEKKWKDAEDFLQPIVEGTSHEYREYMNDAVLKRHYAVALVQQSEGRLMEAADLFNSSSEAISKWRAARIWDEAGMLQKAIKTYIYIAENWSPYQDDSVLI